MTIGAVAGFLLGRRDALIGIAHSRGALLVGALFVLSAGLAREYDGVDLLREPWHLAIPFVASVLTCTFLYALVWFALLRRSVRGPVVDTRPSADAFTHDAGQDNERRLLRFTSLLALFWATAPLAWLYAIPWERLATPLNAVRLNLLTLGLVSLWRVALMVRVLRILAGCGLMTATALVLSVSCLVVFAAGAAVPVPLGLIMAGVRGPPEDVLRGLAVLNATLLASCLFPIFAIVATIAIIRSGPATPPFAAGRGERVSTSVWACALASVAVWAAVLPVTQPPQQLRSRVEEHVEHERFAEATAMLAANSRSDFPPHWQPPPASHDRNRLRGMLERGVEGRLPAWALSHYLNALTRYPGWWNRLTTADLRLYSRLARIDEPFRLRLADQQDVLRALLREAEKEDDPAKREAVLELIATVNGAATGETGP